MKASGNVRFEVELHSNWESANEVGLDFAKYIRIDSKKRDELIKAL